MGHTAGADGSYVSRDNEHLCNLQSSKPTFYEGSSPVKLAGGKVTRVQQRRKARPGPGLLSQMCLGCRRSPALRAEVQVMHHDPR